MNDRHPSGTLITPAPASDASSARYEHAAYATHEAPYGDFTTYGGYDATGFASGHDNTGAFHSDPLFGSLPGQQSTGTYDSTQWQTGHTPHYDPYAAQHHAAYDSGAYDTTAWTLPAQATGNDISGHWDTSAWLQPEQSGGSGPAQQWEWGTQSFETGAYDATQWNSAGPTVTAESGQAAEPFDQQATATFEQVGDATAAFPQVEYEDQAPYADTDFGEPHSGEDRPDGTGELPGAPGLLEDQEEVTPAPATRAGVRSAARSRRRTPAKRSALLTIAVPSACVMGVAGIAAASVGALTDDSKDTTASAPDAQAVKPAAANSKLDTQLRTLSAGADDFADRASRTQERIDLKNQQDLEKRKAAAEAALKERLRPKFVLPVTQKGLSAYFGQAGVNWMSVHTGIDFPVSYGTTVMAATDGTVTTKWNSAYGNMLILTAKDGTQTWYCHLSSYRVPAGTTVKAGQPIAYSGNSGNSTGPHLHFEVHPAGGAAVDPLPWLRSHGLDPT
ncbi:M23 family metallopeptidase [Streptomyces sp. FXJ1.172]|uniref:M23 family metallopeptidase n=1 Tax=Streptomyces sp. FXJ1.172 TaxID=710705 RepID=UPI0007CF3F0F|nr:M23 family metallopeptidase [Streptomyces sp. FXJ1.172]WEO95786.1 M23 family metallopeptidase [Streptomyces sp. FXJ1.172]